MLISVAKILLAPILTFLRQKLQKEYWYIEDNQNDKCDGFRDTVTTFYSQLITLHIDIREHQYGVQSVRRK